MDSVIDPHRDDPWARTVRLLGWVSAPANELADASMPSVLRRGTRGATSSTRMTCTSLADVKVLERLSDVTAAVTWHDPTLCNYESQIWREGTARITGLCALTGVRIVPGEPIYRPIGQPANAGAMIRSVAIGPILDSIEVAEVVESGPLSGPAPEN
ncbi:DUF3331 domain-containing protein [Pararobbsia alpina]|uniref:DUF3331 domain-containing protein n=1 Tax=Pararobbsia alpina TaxID=621374 RepID=UPI0039A4BF5B